MHAPKINQYHHCVDRNMLHPFQHSKRTRMHIRYNLLKAYAVMNKAGLLVLVAACVMCHLQNMGIGGVQTADPIG